MQHDFGVTRGVKHVTGRDELGAQLTEVVDLAVVRELHLAVVGADGLVTAHGVDDREPPMPETCHIVFEEALAVRTAMGDETSHRREELAVRRTPEPGDAAHGRPA